MWRDLRSWQLQIWGRKKPKNQPTAQTKYYDFFKAMWLLLGGWWLLLGFPLWVGAAGHFLARLRKELGTNICFLWTNATVWLCISGLWCLIAWLRKCRVLWSWWCLWRCSHQHRIRPVMRSGPCTGEEAAQLPANGVTFASFRNKERRMNYKKWKFKRQETGSKHLLACLQGGCASPAGILLCLDVILSTFQLHK